MPNSVLRGRPSQNHTGEEGVIIEQAVEQAVALVNLLRREGLEISPKSSVVASSQKLATKVQEELENHGITIGISTDSRDVGADYSGGSRRRITLQKERLQKVKKGVKTVIKMSGIIKSCILFFFTGVKLRAWGYSVMGC